MFRKVSSGKSTPRSGGRVMRDDELMVVNGIKDVLFDPESSILLRTR